MRLGNGVRKQLHINSIVFGSWRARILTFSVRLAAPHLFETRVNKLTGFRIGWEKRCSAFNSNESQTHNFRYLFLTSKNRTLFSRMPLAERTTTMYRKASWFLRLWHYHKRCTRIVRKCTGTKYGTELLSLSQLLTHSWRRKMSENI